MAIHVSSLRVFETQSPAVHRNARGRLFHADTCRTAADVRARAARVLAWRDRMWPSQPPAPPEVAIQAEPPTPAPAPPPPPPRPPVPEIVPPIPDGPSPITVTLIIRTTARHFNVTVEELLATTSKKRPIPQRRWVVMYIARRFTGRSYPYIANLMRFRDHTTVWHGERNIQAMLDAGDVEMAGHVNTIIAQLTGG